MKLFFCGFVLLYFLCLNGCLIYSQEKKDTTNGKNDTTIVEKVKNFTEKDNFFSKLLRNIFVSEDESFEGEGGEENNISNFEKYKGRAIRKINIRVLDVFGPSIHNPHAEASSWVEKSGNSIHEQTRDWLIKNKLFFDKGDLLDPVALSESERLLRQSNFIYDAQIIARPVSRDSVDINVLVQDIWSITGNANISPADNSGYLSLKDLNFLGFGTEVSTTVRYGNNYRNGWNWDGSIFTNNIGHTFFTGQIFHNSNGNDRNFGVSLNKDFFSPVIQWAGGISISWVNSHPLFLTDTASFTQNLYYNQQDLWAGYAFTFQPLTFGHSEYNNINLAVRSLSTLFTKKPAFDTLGIFQNNILYLLRIGLSFRQYEKDRYIFQLGKTEDIPVGYLLEFILGAENGEYRERTYYGIRAGSSTYGKSGFIYGGFQTGAYRDNYGWKDGIFSAEILYFTKLLPLHSLRMRHYLWTRFSFRYDPITQGQLLNINENSGIRGFEIDLLGNKKLTLNYENNIFVPVNFLGFQFAAISFIDFGLLAAKNQSIFNSRLYKGFGFGIRIRNEHLIFPAIQFMFGIYPGQRDPGASEFKFFHQGADFYQFNTFQFSKPSVIEF